MIVINYYNEIKEKLIKSEIYDRAKDYSKDRHKVSVYFEIGRLLSEAGKEYGKNIIRQYSEKLMIEVGKKYKVSNLYKMRKFYEVFSDEKLYPLGAKLSWSHYTELLPIKDENEMLYYFNMCINQNKTIGIIICKEDNHYIIKYCSDDRIIARSYELL